jgi:hypothetical protein
MSRASLKHSVGVFTGAKPKITISGGAVETSECSIETIHLIKSIGIKPLEDDADVIDRLHEGRWIGAL